MLKKGTRVQIDSNRLIIGTIELVELAPMSKTNTLYLYYVRCDNGERIKVGDNVVRTIIDKPVYNPQGSKIIANIVYGEDFTDRQRIKRKIQRWLHKFSNLPEIEQNAIFEALAEKKTSLEAV